MKQIIRIIENNPEITASDLSKKFDLTERTIKRDLKKLTDDKLIEYVGSAKNGYWKVIK
ncbi:HTH domain-containing protein [Lagierella sp. ICN-221743]